MVAFDGIRRVYYLTNFLRIFKKYREFSPVFIPGFQDVRVLLIPLFAELLLGKFSVIKVHSAVDFLQISADCLAVLVRHKLAAVADLVHYAKLVFCFWKNRVYRITKPCKIVMAGDENILDAAVLKVRTYACIEARGLVFGYPGAEDFLLTLHVYTQHRVHAFCDDFVILAGIKYDSIEKYYRVNSFKRTVLPPVYLRHDLVGYPRNQTL